ncbi:MAG: hypothetical protein MHPDNHAH_02892 [Anaerolineales bacterium]|nr:hypothetical protein [Anaerolineales bacterium]WKZ48767.1 MAG: hypothetical protein QY306_05270 [Anaerolineales bacterium]
MLAYDGDENRVSTAHFTGTSGTPDSITSYFMGGQNEVKDGATRSIIPSSNGAAFALQGNHRISDRLYLIINQQPKTPSS